MNPPRRHSPLPLTAVLLLALLLRVWGLTWGLPSATHYFSYHPDESVLLKYAGVVMNVFAGRLLPHFYHYGSLQLYLVCFANTLAALVGAIDIVPKNYPAIGDWYPQWAKMYLVGRLLTVGMGVGTVWAVYGIGHHLWGRRAGLPAALTLAIIPLHAQHSHFLTVDVPATFWGTLSLLWAVRLVGGDPRPLRAALWAGIFAGLATATKYNLSLAILPLVAACWMREAGPINDPSERAAVLRTEEQEARSGRSARPQDACFSETGRLPAWLLRLMLGLLAFVLAFFLACPGAILEHATFLADVRFEAVHVQNAADPTFRDTGNGFLYQITRNLDAGLGWPLLGLALVSVIYALRRRERGDGLLAAFALPYYVLISLVAVRYARYTIPLLPILALWVGRMLADGSRLRRPLVRWPVLAAGSVVLLLTLADVLFLEEPMARQDPRDTALQRINQGAPSATVGFASMPWFGTAPLSPYFCMYQRGGWHSLTPPETLARIVYSGKDWDVDALNARKPEVVVLSEYDYDDVLRLKNPAAVSYLQALDQSYQETYVNIFPINPLGWFGNLPTSVGRMPTQGLPHDMLYTNPYIILYQRKP